MHEVLRRLRHQGRHAEGGPQGAPGDEGQAAGRGELSRLAQHLELGVAGDRVHGGGRSVVGGVLHGGPEQEVGVALQVARGDHLVAGVVGVVEGEVVPPVVEGVAELGSARQGLHLEAAAPAWSGNRTPLPRSPNFSLKTIASAGPS